MKVLLLGGTGAMGVPLIELLSKNDNVEVVVTSRHPKDSFGNVKYLKGNAKDLNFLSSIIDTHYDAIVDFMVYTTEEFSQRVQLYLEKAGQYFFFSSSRCYSDSNGRIREDSPRLVDVCDDTEYLSTDEYGMAKGREENILFNSGKSNWTIIRPYITYNTNRIQLGVYEKENWLRRALAGKTIVFPKDIASKKTSLTYGPDVANALIGLIGNEEAYGQAFHITTAESCTWGEILDFYCDKLEEITSQRPKVKYVENSNGLMCVWNKWQIKYDRLYNREFDNSKIESVCGKYEYKSTLEGLGQCLEEFVLSPSWLDMNWTYEAWCDYLCGEWTPLSEIPGLRMKLSYIKNRLFQHTKIKSSI